MDATGPACDNPAAMPAVTRVLLAGLLFATGGALIKSCEFPSLQRAGLRALVAAVTIFVLLPAARRRLDARILRLVPAYFAATCLFVVANTLTTAADAIFLQSTAPLWLVIFGPLLLGERPSRRDLVTLAGIAVGMALCFAAPTLAQRTAPEPALGNWIALASGVGYAFLLLGMRWLSQNDPGSSVAAIAWGNAFACPLALLLMPVVGQTPILGSASDWIVILLLGSVQVGLAYTLLATAIVHVPAVRVSLLLMIEPAINPLITFAVHGERPHGLSVAGGAVILATVALSALRRSRRSAG
jgi:drug/metabolite transporter, DME family